jgi:TRAP-type C4-dicarboxylate transport system substrate-binding protein
MLCQPRTNEPMRQKTMKRLAFCFLVILFCLIAGFKVTDSAAAEKGPVVLKAVSFLPKTNILSSMIIEWFNRTNAMFPGELKVEYRGGPETIPAVEQVEALRRGIIDIVSYQSPLVRYHHATQHGTWNDHSSFRSMPFRHQRGSPGNRYG